MALTFSNQAATAFKNLYGKSNTDPLKEIGNEQENIFLNIDSNNVWGDILSNDPSVSEANGFVVKVSADLVLDSTSNGHAYFANWPTTPPSGTDPKTGSPFTYGAGLLISIFAGDRVRNVVPISYGYLYEPKPFSDLIPIPIDDSRDWIFQYNSGIFFQANVSSLIPT